MCIFYIAHNHRAIWPWNPSNIPIRDTRFGSPKGASNIFVNKISADVCIFVCTRYTSCTRVCVVADSLLLYSIQYVVYSIYTVYSIYYIVYSVYIVYSIYTVYYSIYTV